MLAGEMVYLSSSSTVLFRDVWGRVIRLPSPDDRYPARLT